MSAIRFEVFVREQGFAAEIEIDGVDPDCAHVLASTADGVPVGTGRLLPDGHIGRIAVLKAHRGSGVGSRITEKLVELAAGRGFPRVELNSQVHAIAFYERLGFTAIGEVFDEAGAPHRAMIRKLSNAL